MGSPNQNGDAEQLPKKAETTEPVLSGEGPQPNVSPDAASVPPVPRAAAPKGGRWDPLGAGLVHTDRYTAQTTSIENGPPNSTAKDRTYIIVGNGRGGTSMVAGVAHYLGLELNTPGGGGFEDWNFSRVAQGLSTDRPPIPLNITPEETTERLRNTVIARNSEHNVWGWKDPSADRYLPELADLLRNPHLIVVWRDPAAIATALMAANGLSTNQAFGIVLNNIQCILDLVDETKWPTLMVSYERGRLKPRELAEEMAEFLGMATTEEELEKIVEFCSPKGGYVIRPGSVAPKSVAEQKVLQAQLSAQRKKLRPNTAKNPEPQVNPQRQYIQELEVRIKDYETQRLTDEKQRDEYRSFIAELESRLEAQQQSDEQQKSEYRAYIADLEERLVTRRERYRRLASSAMRAARRNTP